jgi:IS605 OrfB family transposase
VLARTFGCVRFVYNWALRKKTDAYYQRGERLYYAHLSSALTELKKQEETLFLSEVASVPLQQTLRHLDRAFLNFFEGRAKYPTFKKKHGNPRFFAKDEKKLARAQRKQAKKRKGSKNRDRARRQVARIHARIADRRRDYQHQLSTEIIRENQVVCVESLTVKNMVQNHCLAKSISDVGWGEFVRQLEYKAVWYGRTLVKIDKWYPSSKRCFDCGHVLETLSLDERVWTCPQCAVVHDRDLNAAHNILAAGRAVSACGEAVRPGRVKTHAGASRRSRKASSQESGIPSL